MRGSIALLAAAVAGLALHVRALAWPLVDDAAISAAYALTFFGGDGFRVTPFSQPVEGFSNPLWTLLIGLAVPLRVSIIDFTRSLGIVAGLLALPVFAAWGPAEEDRRWRLEDGVGAVLVATVPTYAGWISSGMETGLHALLLGLSGLLLLRDLRRGEGTLSGLALGLLCLTRPEGPLYVGVGAIIWLAHRARRGEWRSGARQVAGIAAWIAVLAGGWMLFRWSFFADLVPNTYWAKRTWDFDARGYFASAGRAAPWLLAVSLLGAVLSLRRPRVQLSLGFLFAGCVFAWRAKGDWMGEWRFFAPLVPLLGVLVSSALVEVRRWRRGGVFAAVSLAGLALWAGVEQQRRRERVARDKPFSYRTVMDFFEGVAAETARLGMKRPLIAFPDLGGQALTLREAEIIDVAGLGDFAVAHAPGRSAIEDYLISEGPPAFVDVHGPSGYLRGMKTLMARYERWRGSTWRLRGLFPEEDPRCPGGKAQVLALSRDALSRRLDATVRVQPDEALALWRCAFTYRDASSLPDSEQRRAWANRAEAEAGRAQTPLLRLRFLSLATVLDRGDAHRRRKTEQLRSELFP